MKGLYFKKILQMIQSDHRICFVTSDALMEGSILRKAMTMYPGRIIDVGIAEQNLIGVGCGLALSGMIPFVTSMGPFLPLRALDQIHTDIAYNDVPVKLVCVSPGTTNEGGPTHNLICDFAIMNAIPNMMVMAPSDTTQLLKAIDKIVDEQTPVYVRMPTASGPSVYMEDSDFIIGKANEVHFGNDITVIATGTSVYQGVLAAQELEKEQIHVRVLDMHTIKPLDQEAIWKAAVETGGIITVEDHNIQGGLGTLVASAVAEMGCSCKIIKLGIPDEFSIWGSAQGISNYYGYDMEGIMKAIRLNI